MKKGRIWRGPHKRDRQPTRKRDGNEFTEHQQVTRVPNHKPTEKTMNGKIRHPCENNVNEH